MNIKKYVVSYKDTDKSKIVISLKQIKEMIKESKIAKKKPLMIIKVKNNKKSYKLEIHLQEVK